MNTIEFIKKAKAIHGDKYDYSKVEYVNNHTKVCIICSEHGEFWQLPSNHLKGCGCAKCANNAQLTADDFIRKAKEVHGDKYDYSKVEYISRNKKVCIICPIHGEFWQTPNNHLSGKGCAKCASNTQLTTEEFICRAKEVHGDKYDYSKVEYVNANTKVCIICPKHGEFWQTSGSHIRQKQGCPKCGMESSLGWQKNRRMTTEDFIKKAREVHGDKYDYSKVEYNSYSTKVCIICPIHGEFWQTAGQHLSGNGCAKCARNIQLTTEEFIRKAREVHGDKYDYSKTKYISNNTKVCIINEDGKEIWQLPGNHLKGFKGLIHMTTEDFIKKAREVHGDKYDYSKVKFCGTHKKVCIICPEHGEFWQEAKSHLYGASCPRCLGFNKTTEEFIEEIKSMYGDIYDYSKIKYVDATSKVCVICPKHGEFWATPNSLLSGHGCPTCNHGVSRENKLRLLIEDDIKNMSHHQLMELISINAIPKEFKKLVFSEAGSKKRDDTIKELQKFYENTETSEEEIENAVENSINEEEKKYEEEHSNKTNSANANNTTDDTPTTKLDDNVLPNMNDNIVAELIGYDKFNGQLVTYGEKNKFLVEVEKQKIWNRVLKEDESNSKDLIDELIKLRETSSEWVSNVIDEFMDEYKKVQSIVPDEDYKFKYAPKLMQKLMVYKLTENDSYLNLCGTGAGKTNAFLMASRAVGANYSVIICPNSVKDTWEESIKVIYPNIPSVEYESIDDLAKISDLNDAFIIINYDKFSNGSMCTKDKMDNFIGVVKPQFVCFDEIHNAKARDEEMSIRNQNVTYFRQKCNEVFGDGFKVLGMTATPLINNLNEVKSLLELVTGKEFNEIGNRNTIENIHLAYKNLLLYGFRYVPDYGINVVDTEVNIDGEHLKEILITLKNGDVNAIEGTFINDKMEAVKNDLTPGTIVYTTFINKIVPKIEKKLKEFGIKYRRYTGNEDAKERKNILKSFAANEFDILVASSPITTGINGLQECCNKIIFMSLPWTNAEYTQLIGRINRQGSVFDEVNIVFPCINITLENGKVWSWDNKRKNIITKKKTLSDAVVDGVFTYSTNIDKNKLLKGAIEALRNGEATKDFEYYRKDVSSNPKIDETSREYTESLVNEMHRKVNTATSSTMHKYFAMNKDEWYKYHDARDRIRAEWTEDPQDVIASMINKCGACGTIADLGCGRNELKNKITVPYYKWLSFDHLPNDETVIVADTTNLSEYVSDETLDIAVNCVSMWGRNKIDYFKETNRMLKHGGTMYVAVPTDKANQTLFLVDAVSMGFELCEFITKSKFTYFVYRKK